jgi:hypothetical protein
MGDFLKAAKQVATETIEVAGTKVEVRGLTTRELARIAKGKDKNPEGLTDDLIVACCFDKTGKPLIPEDRKGELGEISPVAFKALSEAVARVNGFVSGNSNATDGEGSSSD